MMIINNITPNKNIYKTNKLQFELNMKKICRTCVRQLSKAFYNVAMK